MRSRGKLRWGVAIASFVALASPAFGAETALNVILPLSGNAAFVGKGQQAVLRAIETKVNKEGGIDGSTLHFHFYDDQTSPQTAVQMLNEILPSHPSVMLGSSITGMCNATAPLLKDGPVDYCLTPGVRPAAGSYVFASTIPTQSELIALVRYFRLSGWTHIAELSSTDATGQDADLNVDAALKLPENADVKMIERLHFNPTDLSVTAQLERIKASGAQALIEWTTGTQVATIFRGMVQTGLDIPIGTSPGNQTFESFAQFQDFLPKHLIMPSAYYPEHDGIYTLDPRVEKAQHDMYRELAAASLRADNSTATAWDPALIVVEALRRLGLGARPEQIRDYISNLTDFPGVDGLYNFKKSPQRGLDDNDCVMTTYDPQQKRWVWLSGPGGVLLNH